MLTALGQDQDRIVGLEIGADDYLPKPFNPRELLARIKAVLRRTSQERSDAGDLSGRILRFGGLTLDTDAHVLIDRDGNRLQLTTADFRLLTVLLARPRTVLSREQLLDLTAGRAAGLAVSRVALREATPSSLPPKYGLADHLAAALCGQYCGTHPQVGHRAVVRAHLACPRMPTWTVTTQSDVRQLAAAHKRARRR